MALGTIATVAAIAAAATSISSAAYAATRKAPSAPDGASSSAKVAGAQAHALPDQLRLAQLAQQGGKGMVNMPAHTTTKKFLSIPATGTAGNTAQKIGGKVALAGGDLVGGITSIFKSGKNKPYPTIKEYNEGDEIPDGAHVFEHEVWVPEGPQEVDFTGFGTADIEGNRARRQADLELELGRKYGTEFATTARQLQEQADPLGTQARALEYELLNKDMPKSALPGMLDEQIRGQLAAGRGYDSMSRELLDSSLEEANAARGGNTGAAAVAQSGSTGYEGQARLNAATSKAGQFLASGVTPEDIDFKRTQQKIANQGAFVNGQTPQSQFGNIANAGQGATPVSGAQANATMPNNAGSVGQQYGVNAYAANVNQQLSQPNNWFAGLSSLLTGIGSMKTAGG